ncbi:MAG: DUF5053 domain-containing protein [Bacteroidaceae bacterium]|nr:DUF5053 domain-containing protein [Bacteroidaceae bacterium]
MLCVNDMEMTTETKNLAIKEMYNGIGRILNFSALSNLYFCRTPQWMMQRIHSYKVNGKPAFFKDEECVQMANALRDIANQLNEIANTIDNSNQ